MKLDKPFDEILKQTTAIKKEKGEDEAVHFLVYTFKEFELEEYDCVLLLKKLTTYAGKAKSYSQLQVINFILEVFNRPQGFSSSNKVEIFSELGNYYWKIQKFTEAEQSFFGAIGSLTPSDSTNYLYKLMELQGRIADCINKSNRNVEKKAVDFLFYKLSNELLQIAWQLFVDGKSNIERFVANQYVSSLGFKSFEVYHKILESANNDLFAFEDEPTQEAMKVFILNPDFEDLAEQFRQIAFVEFPDELGFRPKFLRKNYQNLKEFATSFADNNGNIHFDDIIPSKAAIISSDMVNEFIKIITEQSKP